MAKGLVGVIGGTVLSESSVFSEGERTTVSTPYGPAEVYASRKALLVQRHASSRNTPPHSINHRANIWALQNSGAKEVVGVGSSGSLRRTIKPPCIVVPDDFLQLSDIPTFFDYKIVHVTPSLDPDLRGRMISAAKKLKVKVLRKGVYAQTRGPRLETKAEVRLLSSFADIVGMTLASEATLARELKLPYAMLCSVDNYAHGLAKEALDFKKIKEDSLSNSARMESLLRNLI